MTVLFCGGKHGYYGEYSEALYALIVEMADAYGPVRFLFAGEGNFDRFALQTVRELKRARPFVRAVLVTTFPLKHKFGNLFPYDAAVFPDRVRDDPQNAEIERDRWMADKCDAVITCSPYDAGRIALVCGIARARNKPIYNLYGALPDGVRKIETDKK